MMDGWMDEWVWKHIQTLYIAIWVGSYYVCVDKVARHSVWGLGKQPVVNIRLICIIYIYPRSWLLRLCLQLRKHVLAVLIIILVCCCVSVVQNYRRIFCPTTDARTLCLLDGVWGPNIDSFNYVLGKQS